MTPGAADAGAPAERGFTLVELVLVAAVVALAAALGVETLAERPAQARGSAAAFAELVAQARALAAVTGDAGGSGATIGVTRAGGVTVATLYAYRPELAATQGPLRAVSVAPLQTPTLVALVNGNAPVEPPFALFISASGHLSARAPYTVGVDAPLAVEPVCPVETGIRVAFIDGVHDQVHTLSCEAARLDLDSVGSLGAPP